MKIALYAGMFEENKDGATKALYELVDSLIKKGHEVGVWGFSITPQEKEGLHLHTIPSIPFPLYREYRVTMPSRKLKRQIAEFNPDIIHITVPDLVGVSLMKFARKRGIPVLMSFHTDFPSYLKSFHLGILYKPSWKFFRWFYNNSGVVLAPTEEVARKLEGHGINNVKLWSRGIHLDQFNPKFRSAELREEWGAQDEETRVILFSGRFVWYKDLDTFMDVYDRFKDAGIKNVKFVMAGDGPVRNELNKRMPDAIYPGYLSGEKLSKAYASADLLLFPSTTETFGNVVLEALASGLPSVVSDIGGCQEVVMKSEGGLVAKAEDPDSFFEQCCRLITDVDFYKRLKANGLAYAKERTWENINRKVLDEYEKLVGKTTGDPGSNNMKKKETTAA